MGVKESSSLARYGLSSNESRGPTKWLTSWWVGGKVE